MKEEFQQLLHYLIELYLKNEEQQVIFSRSLILILRIQQALLSLSYVYGSITFSYIGVFSALTRPQQFLPQSDAIQYVILVVCVIYILNLFSIIPHTKYIGIFGQLLRCGIMNIIFEYSIGQIQILTHSFLILISLSETLVLQGTLNASTINFQNTRYNLLEFTILLLNYTIMILYSYQYSQESITIIAITITIIKAINQYFYSPYKNLNTKSILLTINIATIYLSVMHILSLQKYFTPDILLLPFIFAVIDSYYKRECELTIKNHKQPNCIMIQVLNFLDNIQDIKEINIKKPQDARDRVIYASLLMLQDKNYEAFLEISSINGAELNFLQKFKKRVIMKQCMNKINNKIQIESHTSNKLAQAVASLMSSEESNYTIQNEIVHILKDKIKCQQFLLQKQTYSTFNLYVVFIEKLLKIKNQLEKQYEEFPCDKTQGILGFFYVEVMNDYLLANSLFSVIALSDEKVKRINTNQDIFSSKMVYIIATFRHGLTIQRLSNDAPQFLNKETEQFIGKSTSILIPPGIAEHHDKLIIAFLQKGSAKFLGRISPNYLFNTKEQTMITVEFTFEVDFRSDFSFISFIQPSNNQKLAIVINQQERISCFSDALIEQLGLQSKYQIYYGMYAKQILPEFQLVISGQHIVENCEIHFPSFQDIISPNQMPEITYFTSYTVSQCELEEKIAYYIVTFDFFKKVPNQFQSSHTGLSPSYLFQKEDDRPWLNDINEESIIRIPYREIILDKKNTSTNNQLPIQEKEVGISYQSGQISLNELKLFQQVEYTNLLSPCKFEDKSLLDSPKKQYFSKPRLDQSKLQISEAGDEQQVKQIVYQDDRSSQISSLQGARKSKYYKKFEIFVKINDMKSFSQNHKLFLAMFICCITFQLIVQIIQLIAINANLTNLASDIDLLQIKNFIFQPLETFLVTRWTIVNYNILRDTSVITLENYQSLVKFPRSNLQMGYNQLDSNLKQVFNRPQLQDFLENTSLNIYIYKTTNIGEIYYITLRNSINILLNYQYTFKMAYIIDGTAVADSPYVYYQYRNYLQIKSQFSQLNEIILQQTILRANNIQLQLSIIYTISMAGLFIFLVFTLYYLIQITKNINKYYQLMHNIAAEYVDHDQARQRLLIEKIIKDQNILFKYLFNLEQKEKQFDNKNELNISIKRNNAKLRSINSQDIYLYLFLLAIVILIAGNGFLTYYEGDNYLAKYPDTAKFYKAVSDVSTDVPTMYAQRDVLYGRANFLFFNQQDFNAILDQIKEAVDRTSQFLSVDYDFSKYLVSYEFEEFFESAGNGNACDYLPDELAEKSLVLCPEVMGQNMKRGLKAILVYIVNFINTDMAINQFTIRTQGSYLELEGGFLVSNIIKVINDQFNIDLGNQTQQSINSINVHNIIFQISLFFIIILIITQIQQRLIHKLHVVQRLIYLLPAKTVFLDDSFERNIRQLLQFC